MAGLEPACRDEAALAACASRRGRAGKPARRPRALSHAGDRDALYRIHGTNEPEKIGRAVSSGCIRMRNIDVIDSYNRVEVGTKVVMK